MQVLSIQSHVAYGHVGNASAVFPMQRMGVDVWPIHTVQFSNHTGYGAWRGRVFDGPAIEEVVQGVAERGVLGRCDAVLSGYMGSPDIGTAILDAVAQVRAANPDALYCCDPVIGDTHSGIYVRPGISELMCERAVPAADIVTPNQFELNLLSGLPTATLREAKAAAQAVQALGPRVVLVTSLATDATPPDAIDMLAGEGGAFWRLRTPRLDLKAVSGAGDAVAALFLVHYLRTGSAATALGMAGASIHGLLRQTAEAGSTELLTVEAQDEFVSPSVVFPVEAV
ncbi:MULTISPECIES: pyridoxal kinase PdxY [Methylobacterium]|uniref:pyridoxal kinase n=1 Tax=Methylobacterium thuringiense TaxID=1003091 RepID=A0ABQ4TQD5_9HYPH|nr:MULTISPECIES: pyridoxal kinase PdxY [Methylobacterium]TXN24200.1 pyridoxal kinase PdxY [Methylobacterium sp. WL9]GJE56250.1 Pyridoxal kinase PdxY [Methylobacterium thuringiense]